MNAGKIPHARPAPQPYPDDDEEDEVYGDPSKVRDEGPLDSLGRAISSPVVDGSGSDKPSKKPAKP